MQILYRFGVSEVFRYLVARKEILVFNYCYTFGEGKLKHEKISEYWYERASETYAWLYKIQIYSSFLKKSDRRAFQEEAFSNFTIAKKNGLLFLRQIQKFKTSSKIYLRQYEGIL